jgi:hypothetical protein
MTFGTSQTIHSWNLNNHAVWPWHWTQTNHPQNFHIHVWPWHWTQTNHPQNFHIHVWPWHSTQTTHRIELTTDKGHRFVTISSMKSGLPELWHLNWYQNPYIGFAATSWSAVVCQVACQTGPCNYSHQTLKIENKISDQYNNTKQDVARYVVLRIPPLVHL